MGIEALKQELKAVLEQIDAVLSKASKEKRALSAEEQAEHDELEKTFSNLEATIARVEKAEARKKDLSKPATESVHVEILRHENHNEKGEYRGFKSFGEQLQAVKLAGQRPSQADKRLREVSLAVGMNESNDSDGGFLLQSDFILELDKGAMENANLPQYCAKLPVGENSNGTSEPYLSETSRADGSRNGGARAYWEKEAGTITKSQLKFDALELKLRKLTCMVVCTDEQLQDSTFLGGYVQEVYHEEMGFAYDAAIFEGSGVKEPKGFFNTTAYLAVAKVSGQAADSVVAGNVTAMFAAMTPRGQRSGVFLCNPEVWGQLPLMTIGQQPVFIPPGGLTGLPYATLLGRPVVTLEACSKLGDNGDFVFADLKAYRLIEKGAIETAQSIHVYFDTGETAFRFIKRANGAPRIKSTITPYKGNSGFKLSCFVGVADRT